MIANPEPDFDQLLDITADLCPMTFVRTRLALDRMDPGAVLKLRLRGEEPRQNVPRQAEALGHAVLQTQTGADGVTTVWLRKRMERTL